MATATILPRSPAATRRGRWWLLLGGCSVAAALTLVLARQTTYDPTAWLIWGREVVHGDLSTTHGPSWKPLPVLVTAPASLLGDAAQQEIWLVVARAGALVAIALAGRLAWRLGGLPGGIIAACALVVSGGFVSHSFRGNSEGLLAALALGAVEAHLSGRRRLAFAILVATGLLRPEMWLLVVGYGLGLARDARRDASSRRLVPLLAAVVVGLAAWLVPEEIGSGELLRAASRAREPVAGSPAQAAHPFLATFTNAAPVLPWPVYAGGIALVLAALLAVRRRGVSLALALAAIATALMVVVAAMTQGGFTGNTRYLTVPIALTCVLGGAGLACAARSVRSWLSASWTRAAIAVAVIVAAPFVAHDVGRLRDEMRTALDESRTFAALPGAIARAGGREALLRCPPVYTTPSDTQAIARELRVHASDVLIHPRPPGTIVVPRGSAPPRDQGFRTIARTSLWVIGSTCAG